jgi:hypothetical protein
MELFTQQPLQAVIPSYLYDQYSDDADLQAFIDSYNAIAQGYLNWFNGVQFCIYTSANISGALLDWIGNNLFGVTRPILLGQGYSVGPVDTYPVNSQENNAMLVSQGSATYVTDDIYKRVLTWATYLGDGKQLNLIWLRRRIARFIYGANGEDIDIGLIANIGLVLSESRTNGEYNTASFNELTFNELGTTSMKTITISAANSPAAVSFQQLVESGMIQLPFQYNFEVSIA